MVKNIINNMVLPIIFTQWSPNRLQDKNLDLICYVSDFQVAQGKNGEVINKGRTASKWYIGKLGSLFAHPC